MVWCGLVGVRATAVVLEAFALVVPYGLGTIAVGLGWMWRAGSDALRGASATSVVAGASGCLTIFLKIRRLAFNYQKVTWTVSCQRICWMTSGPLAPEQWTDAAKYLRTNTSCKNNYSQPRCGHSLPTPRKLKRKDQKTSARLYVLDRSDARVAENICRWRN